MKLKTGLGLRGFPGKSMINFYNGSEVEIEVEEFEAFWELLKLLKENDFEPSTTPFSSWRTKYNKSLEDLLEVKNGLEQLGMLYESKDINPLINRNFNFFSTYDNSLSSTELMNKISKLRILIIGCGTLGSSIALALSKLGVGTIVLIDFDNVEEKNIVAQYTFGKDDIGQKKNKVIERNIKNSAYNTKVYSYDFQVEKAEDIHKILEEHEITYVINSFDVTSANLHMELVTLVSDLNINYILTGYSKDTTTVLKLDASSGIPIIKESYLEFDPNLIISSNRGTILNSLMGSQLVANLIISEQINENYNKPRKITYDLQTMELENSLLEPSKPFSQETFLETLNRIYPPDILEKSIQGMIGLINENGLNLAMEVMEEELLNIHQFFDLLVETDLLAISPHENNYELFLKLIELVDQDDSDNTYSEYISIIDEIDSSREIKNYSNIYTELMNLNLNHNFEEKYGIQKSIFQSIYARADELIQIINQQKVDGLSLDQEIYDREVIGLNSTDLNKFESIMEEKYPKALKDLYSMFLNLEGGDTFDYLEDKKPDTTYFGDFNKALESIKLTFKGKKEFLPVIYHIDKLKTENKILVSDLTNHNNINKTVYFSSKREGVIVLTYDNTLDALLTVVHEIGHSYYNSLFSGHSFTDKSNRVINETLAHYFQYEFMIEFLESPHFDETTKNHLKVKFIERFSKGLLSNFSIRLLEKKVLNHIKNEELTIESFLSIRKECEVDVSDYVKYENSDIFYLNLLIYPYFCFNYKDYISDTLSIVTAINLYHSTYNPLDRRDEIKSFLDEESFEVSSLYRRFFKKDFADIISFQIDNCIDSLKNL